MKNLPIIAIFFAVIFGVFLILSCQDQPTEPVRENILDPENPNTGGDPFNLTAQIAGGGIKLTWTVITEFPSVIGYNIYRKADNGAFSQLHQISGVNVSNWTDTNIQNGHKYSYYIVTRNTQGQESTSNIANVEINNTPVMSIDQGDTTSSRTVNLTLLAFGAVKMQIGAPNLTGAGWVNYAATSSVQLSTGSGTKTVQARFAYSNGDTSSVVSDNTQPLSMNPAFNINNNAAETELTAVTLYLLAQGANLKYMASENSAFSGTNWQNYTNPANFTLSSEIGSKTIYVKFKNDFEIESSAISDAISYVYCIAPSNLTAQANETSITLNWQDNSNVETGYKIERKAGAGGNYSPIDTVGQNVENYTDSNLISGTTYYYRVRGYNSQGNSGYSNDVNISFVVTFSKIFGDSGNDYGYSVLQTSDGGYIIAGRTSSYGAGAADVYLLKTDANGNEQWWQTFGGSSWDYGNSVQPTTDGGFIIAGHTESYGASWGDVYLIKTNSQGNEQWSQAFGGESIDWGYSIQQTSDGGFVIAGLTYSYGAGDYDVYLIRTAANGNEQWSQTFGGSSEDEGNSVQQTADGGFIIAGTTSSYGAGNEDVYLIKTDNQGNEQWSQTFGGSDYDEGNSAQQTIDGGFIIAGYTASYGAGSADVYLIKTDSQGNEQWDRTFGGSSSDYGNSVQPTTDGGFIISGSTISYGAGSRDVYLIKTDSQGNEQWSQTFGGSDWDWGNSVQQTTDGGFIIAGYTSSYGAGSADVYLIKTDSQGNVNQ